MSGIDLVRSALVRSGLVRRAIELLRTTALRWAVACAAIFALGVLLFAALMYRETVGYLTRRVDAGLQANVYSISRGLLSDEIEDVGEYLQTDPEQFKVAGLFDAHGRPLAGNLRALPTGLAVNRISELRLSQGLLSGTAMLGADPALVRFVKHHPQFRLRVRVLAEPLAEGRVLLVGVGASVLYQVDAMLSRALWVTVPPMLLLALGIGWIVSRGALRRIAQVHDSSRRIMAGQLNERLPTRGTGDAFDQLSNIVNSMLDEIERLLLETRGVSEGIAHDLRTPLTRLRARLECAMHARLNTDTRATLAAGLGDIDQILGTIRALLRIAEVEQGARRAAFAPVDLRRVLSDVIDLYEPIAQERRLTLRLELEETATAEGDAELLFEAVANLVDNAIKFSPAGSEVAVSLRSTPAGPCVRVADQGPGIAPDDWGRVTRRFFRADRSRHTPGNGLGLSLVAAIMRLHGFGLGLDTARRGCCIELECWVGHAADGAVGVLAADEPSRAAHERIAAAAYAVAVQVGPSH